MSDDWPGHTQELTRKTALTLEDGMARFEQGQWSLDTLIAVTGALWDATSGLVDDDLSDTLAEVHRELSRDRNSQPQ